MIALASIKLAMVLILKSVSESIGGKWVRLARPKWVEPIRVMGQNRSNQFNLFLFGSVFASPAWSYAGRRGPT